jgi:hypothetical protein
MAKSDIHEKEFSSFRQFYEYYLSEHTSPLNRRLHFAGCILVLIVVLTALLTRDWTLLVFAPVFGYGLAWTGHFFVEKNKPSTFRHPLWSLMGDWAMFRDIMTGKIKL